MSLIELRGPRDASREMRERIFLSRKEKVFTRGLKNSTNVFRCFSEKTEERK